MSEVRTLEELLGRVEAASGKTTATSRKLDHEIEAVLDSAAIEKRSGYSLQSIARNYSESIDAAVALVEKKLPGVNYVLRKDSDQSKWDGRSYAANIGDMPHEGGAYWVVAPTPALALIAALLRALIAQETK